MVKQKTVASVHERVSGLEKWLEGVYAKTPVLPVGVRNWISNNLYWLAAISGILGLWGAYSLWQVARWGDNWAQYSNDAATYYGVSPVGTAFSPLIWAIVVVVAIQAVIALMAVGPLKAHRKAGWNLLFYSALLSVGTALLYLIMDGYGISSTISSLVGCAVGLYFLFQIRSHFVKA